MKKIANAALRATVLLALLTAAFPGNATAGPRGEKTEPPAERPLRLEARAVAPEVPPPPDPFLSPNRSDYRIGRQDLLEITVFDVEDLDQTVRVADDGSISMPLLGRLVVAGLTKTELEQLIARLLAERYVHDPQVTVFVKEYESKRVAVSGAVKKPGTFEMLGRKTILEMISMAGGLDKDPGKLIIIFRRTDDGPARKIPLDLEQLVYEADPTLNLVVEPGDIIYVPTIEKVRIFVSGAVKNPDLYEVPRSEPVTVLKAITLAGGPTDRAAEKRVQVIRTDPGGHRVTLLVNLRKVKRGKAEDPILKKDDLVLVPGGILLMHVAAGGKDLLHYWSILARRRWVVLLAVVTFGLIALIGSVLVAPVYRSTVTLRIERQNPDVLTFRDLAKVDYSWIAYREFFQTQYKIISSDAVARKAVQSRGLASHPFFAVEDSEPGLLDRIKALIPGRKPEIESEPLDVAATRLLTALEVAPVRNSQLVRISWVATDPQFAADVANAVADAYIHFNISSQYSTSDQARIFLVDQIGMLKREIGAIEERLQEYGESKQIVSIDEANNVTLQALKDIAEQRTEAQTESARAEAAYHAVVNAPANALPEVLNSSLVASLRQEYAAYEAEISEKSRLFKEDWPGLQTLESKFRQARTRLELEIERIASQVRAAREAEYLEAAGTVDNLERLLETKQTDAQRLKRDAVEYANLDSEVRKKRETLNALIGRQNEMALSTRLKGLESTSTTNIQVMEAARVPTEPFRPRTKLNLLLGLILGLALGAAGALFLDYLDNSIGSPDELEAIVALPVLAVIPRHGESGTALARVRRRGTLAPAASLDLVVHRDARSGVSEAYRGLRTSILLSNPGEPPRRIMVTSALPEEGKTVTAINLSVVLAQLGRRVLLVDTDLRRPRLHKPFGLDNGRGVSTCLSGLETDPTRLILPTGIDNLDLLPSGPPPPNPSELLNSEVFTNLGAHLLERGYDHIVFDSPPVLSVSDPVIIAQSVDTGVLLVRAGRTARQSVRLAADRLKQTGGGPFGVVLNDFDPESQGPAYYRHDYYDRYEEPAGDSTASSTERAHGTGA